MALPTPKIDQTTPGPGIAGVSRDDLVLGELVTLTDPANSFDVVYEWRLLDTPQGSAIAPGVFSTSATASFTPDVSGTYLIKVTAGGVEAFIAGAVKTANKSVRIPAVGETDEFGLSGWHPALDTMIRAWDVEPAGADALVLDVTRFGAVGDGVTDCSAAVTAALAAIPNAVSPYSDARTTGGGVIYFPALSDPDQFYRFGSEVTIPRAKNVTIRGAGSHSSRIKTDPGVDYAFFRDAPDGVFYICDITDINFDRCGVRIEDNSRNGHTFERLFFKETPDFAILLQSIDRDLGSIGSVIGGIVRDCEFENCFGAILCEGIQSDNWLVQGNTVTRAKDCGFKIYGSGWHIVDNYFEQKHEDGDLTKPYINIAGDTGDMHLIRNRFGNEVGNGTEPPRECIVIGTLDASESGHQKHIEIIGNNFRGRGSGGPNTTSANVAIRFNVGVSHCKIKNNFFFPYNTSYIQFAHADPDYGVGNEVDGFFEDPTTTPLFDVEPPQGPLGAWFVHGREAPPLPSEREVVQLLKNTDSIEDSVSWSESNATIAKDAIGPDGLANSAYTLTKPASGSSTVFQNPTPTTTDTDVVVSCWFKKGSGVDTARLFLSTLVPTERTIKLTDEWVQHWFWLPVGEAAVYTFFIGAGGPGDAQTGTILFANPQMELGRVPTAHLPRTDATARSRPGGWIQLGKNIIGYGSEAPTSGDFIAGDRVFNNEISGSSPHGWEYSDTGWRDFGREDQRLNVRDFGAVGDGITNDAPAFEAALAAIPDATTVAVSRTKGGNTIYIPPPEEGASYHLATTVAIPGTKNVRITGAGPYSSTVTSDQDYAFRKEVSGNFKSFVVENMTFDGCGITVAPQARNHHQYSRLQFLTTPDYAIKLEAAGGEGGSGGHVNGVISDCRFTDCYGAVICEGHQSDNWVISWCSVTRSEKADFKIFSASWRIIGCAFEQRASAANGGDQNEPNIHIGSSTAIASVLIDDCRFGNEVGSGTEPPRENIVIGLLGTSEVGVTPNIRITRNYFRGRAGSPSATSANAAIRLNKGLEFAYIAGNYFFNYYECLIQFAHANSHDGRGNRLDLHNHMPNNSDGATPLFSREPSQGKYGSWFISGRDYTEPLDLGTVQLARNTDSVEDSIWWTESNTSVVKDAVGPSGVANSAYTLTTLAPGSALITNNPQATGIAGPWASLTGYSEGDQVTANNNVYTCITAGTSAATTGPTGSAPSITDGGVVWEYTSPARWVCVYAYFKRVPGSAVTHARLNVSSSVPDELIIPLTDDWELAWFTLPVNNAVLALRIGTGVVGQPTTGSMLMANPGMVIGRSPPVWHLDRDESDPRSRPGGWLQLGNNIIGSASNPPTSGNFIVGDRVLNDSPDTGTPIGYECVASGSPGTWQAIGLSIAAEALTDAASIATDAEIGHVFTVTLSGNRTLTNPTNLVTGREYTWIISQDGTGSRTLSYGDQFKWPGGSAPTLTTTAGAVDVIKAVYDGTNLLAQFTADYS